MEVIPFALTEKGKRQRTIVDKTKLHELKEKIAAKGVLHPPVYWLNSETGKWILTAGERRSLAIAALHEEKREVRCNGQVIPPGHLPITRLDDFVDEVGRFEVELDENIEREDLSWQDRARAFADLHIMRQAANPKQTLKETGQELINRGIAQSKEAKSAEREVSRSLIIAEHLSNEKIAKARNASEAEALVYKIQEEQVLAVLARRQLATLPENPSIEIRHGDSLKVLSGLVSDTVDLVVVDPPYGIGAGTGGFRQRTVHHHNYEDTPENARKLALEILTEGFRICKARANIFMFCDIDLFPWLKEVAANMGWSPFRRPLIWQKSESEGLAPWGGQGPRITTEFIFYATKGRRGLISSPIDVFPIKRVPRAERIHAAEKPVELLSTLIKCATLPGDLVLDPCCGSGSTLVACKETKRRGIGIEKDLDFYNTAMANVFGKDIQNPPATTDDLVI